MGNSGETVRISKAQREFLDAKPKHPLWNENTPCPSPQVTSLMWRLFIRCAKNPDAPWGIAPEKRVSIRELKKRGKR